MVASACTTSGVARLHSARADVRPTSAAMRVGAAAPMRGMFSASPLALAPRAAARKVNTAVRAESDNGTGESSANNPSSGLSLHLLEVPVIPQGLLVSGVKASWRTTWGLLMNELAPQTSSGGYARPSGKFTGWIGRDQEFPIEYGRYHLYVGNACPWCHRVLLTMALRSLQPHITISVLKDDAEKASRGGWVFDKESPDPVWNCRDLKGVYDRASPGLTPYVGRCTAPLLVDKKRRRIVSNDSSDIIRMLNEFDLPGGSGIDLYPKDKQAEIEKLNFVIYDKINNGVYKSGFATKQAAYDRAQIELYDALEEMDKILSKSRFLMGDKVTESDVKLFPTIVRYDTVYATLFKCSRRRIRDYPHLDMWMRDMYQLNTPGGFTIRETYDAQKALESYFGQLFPLNAGGIIPSGPLEDDMGLNRPHSRGRRQDNIFYVKDPSTMVHTKGTPSTSSPGMLPGAAQPVGRLPPGARF